MALINYIDLNRATYITPTKKKDRFDFVSARYKNMRWLLRHTETYEVTSSDIANLPGIAFRVYGDVSMWRMILAFNGLQDPIQDMWAGQVLNLPSKAAVIAYLNEQLHTQQQTFTI